jgi:DNA-binding transcriptional MerR regulator
VSEATTDQASQAAEPVEADAPARRRIGEIAQQAGVTTRTLRYYQEMGLLEPGHSPGGSRRYTDADAARLRRIIELRSVMGFDLERIREILASEDRLGALKAEVRRGTSNARRREIVAEAIRLNARMQEQVRAKRAVLDSFLLELKSKAASYRTVAVELGLDLPDQPPPKEPPQPEPAPTEPAPPEPVAAR